MQGRQGRAEARQPERAEQGAETCQEFYGGSGHWQCALCYLQQHSTARAPAASDDVQTMFS